MSNVIFTADDYGAIPAIDQGIIHAVNAGKINSVAAFSNHNQFRQKLDKLQNDCAGQNFEIGAHLTISSGKPVSDRNLKWFTRGFFAFGKKGYFKKYTQLNRAHKDERRKELFQLERELCAQVERFIEAKIEITHLSCHHNTLMLFSEFHEVFFEVGKKFDLAVRSPLNRPSQMNDLYVSLVMMRLFDNINRGTRQEMLDHMRAMRTFLATYPNPPVMPDALSTIHYGPLALPTNRLNDHEIESYANEKEISMERALRYLKDEDEAIEFVFHLIDDDPTRLEKYCDQTRFRNSKYTGIDDGYFDSRMAEQRAILNLKLPEYINLVSWKSLKKKFT